MRHLKRFGGIYLLGLFMVVTTLGYWHQSYAYTRHEVAQACAELKAESPGATCPAWETQDQRTHFWNGVWENDRSEYEQLLMQSLILIAFGTWLLTKESEDRKADVRAVLREEGLVQATCAMRVEGSRLCHQPAVGQYKGDSYCDKHLKVVNAPPVLE